MTGAAIQEDTIRHLASLSRIAIEPGEAARLSADLAQVLRYMDRLAACPTADVPPWRPTDPWPPLPSEHLPPAASSAEGKDPPSDWRADIPGEPLSPERLAAAAGSHLDPDTGLFDAPAAR